MFYSLLNLKIINYNLTISFNFNFCRFIMASSSSQSALSLKETIASLQKQLLELESHGVDAYPQPTTKQVLDSNNQVLVLPQRRIMAVAKESSSTKEAPIPTYKQLFCAPSKKDRDPNLLYGKDFLSKYYHEKQHVLHCQNLRTVRGFMKDFLVHNHCDLRHNKEGKDMLKSLIEEHYGCIMELKFGSTTHKWDQKDIYDYCLHHLQAKRKNSKIKGLTSLVSFLSLNLNLMYFMFDYLIVTYF